MTKLFHIYFRVKNITLILDHFCHIAAIFQYPKIVIFNQTHSKEEGHAAKPVHYTLHYMMETSGLFFIEGFSGATDAD
jgi:hypothetical protein